MKKKLILSILLLSLQIIQSQVPTLERDALIALYNSTDGVNWNPSSSTNWNTSLPVSDWSGITVENISGQDHIVKIELASSYLNGTLPNEIGNIAELKHLEIIFNGSLTGNIPTSIGHAWQQGPINSPTVLNSGMNLAQFWDGRAEDLKAQAGGPIANPGEMASNHELAVEILSSIPQYRGHFEKAFGSDVVNINRVTTAIAAFEETLVTPGSRFDMWLEGNKRALDSNELEGYKLFKSAGCAGCHNGPAVGGALYQKFGVHRTYKTDSTAEGRKGVTGKDSDLHVFKVPTLRNIELTYPYFHDGAVWTLEEAVDTMGKVQLDRDFSEKEIGSIVAFLKTLTGDQPDFKMPILPPSTNDTPRPQPFN